jgi:hypothetical protein
MVRQDQARYGVDVGQTGVRRLPSIKAKSPASYAAAAKAVTVFGAIADYLCSTRAGRLLAWEGLLDNLDLRGDEHVLDIVHGPIEYSIHMTSFATISIVPYHLGACVAQPLAPVGYARYG